MVNVTRIPEIKADRRDVQVVMDIETAQTLKGVLARVGGMPGETPRGRMDKLSWALDSAGVESDASAQPIGAISF